MACVKIGAPRKVENGGFLKDPRRVPSQYHHPKRNANHHYQRGDVETTPQRGPFSLFLRKKDVWRGDWFPLGVPLNINQKWSTTLRDISPRFQQPCRCCAFRWPSASSSSTAACLTSEPAPGWTLKTTVPTPSHSNRARCCWKLCAAPKIQTWKPWADQTVGDARARRVGGAHARVGKEAAGESGGRRALDKYSIEDLWIVKKRG